MTARSIRRRAGLLGVAAAAVAAAWVIAPAGVPVYDGIGSPDEPYRYVAAPVGAKATKPPTSAVGHSPVINGLNAQLFFLTSLEQGPQVTVSLPSRSLADPAAHTMTVRAVPRAPDSQPAGARTNGNVYRVTFSADAGSVTPARNLGLAYVVLRATSGRQPGPTMYYRATTSWRALHTSRVGNDIYQSAVPGPGDYVLAFPTGKAAQAAAAKASSSQGLIILLVVLVVGIAVFLLSIRLIRYRTA